MKNAGNLSRRGPQATFTSSSRQRRLNLERLEDRTLLAVGLDPTFDGDGRVITPIQMADVDQAAYAMAVQADGKIVLGGYSYNGESNNFALARLNADGTLDTTFSGDGTRLGQLGSRAEIYDLAIQADGKIVAVGTESHSSDGVAVASLAVTRYNPDGSLDASFADGGVLIAKIGSTSEGRGLAIQADGKIVVVGTAGDSGTRRFAVARFNSDGSPDPAFSDDGVETTAIDNDAVAESVAIQPDGMLVVAGAAVGRHACTGALDSAFAVARYNPDGSLDATFSGNGLQECFRGFDWAQADSVAVQADGKIVVAGGAGSRLALARLMPDGQPDNTFDGDGEATTAVGTFAVARDVLIQPNGKIVVSGESDLGFVLARYNADGLLDASLHGDGIRTLQLDALQSGAYSAALGAGGRLIAAGGANNGMSFDFAAAQFNSDGDLDSTFSGDGIAIVPIHASKDTANDVAIQGDGKIVVVGRASRNNATEFTLARYNPNGSLDTTFDGDGRQVLSSGSNFAYATSVAIQADGGIVVAGTWDSPSGGLEFLVARYRPDGTLDPAFGGDGMVNTPVLSFAQANDVAIQSDGKIVVAGKAAADSNYGLFAVVRYNSDGSLDSSFGFRGVTTIGVGGAFDCEATSLALDPDGKIVVAGSATDYYRTHYFCGLARFNPNGVLDAQFGNGGTVAHDSLGGHDFHMAVQPDGLIVVASDPNDTLSAFLVTRFRSNGSLDDSFGGHGTASAPVGMPGADVSGIALQPDGRIIVSGDALNGSDADFTLVRFHTDGRLDPTFGVNGVSTAAIGPSNDQANAVALQADGRIVVVGSALGPEGLGFAVARFTNDLNRPPVADAGGPYTASEGSTVMVTAAGTTDPDLPGDTLHYSWDLDGDGQYDDASGVNALFSAVGRDGPSTATVRLLVWDDHGGVSSDTAAVSIINANPMVDAGTDKTALVGTPVNFVGQARDPGGDTLASIAWNFGDGTEAVSGTLIPTHTFAAPGQYTVTLTVVDKDGGRGSDSLLVQVNDSGSAVYVSRIVYDAELGDASDDLQRSTITRVLLTFSGLISQIDAGAFGVVKTGGGTVNLLPPAMLDTGGVTQVALGFAGGNSLVYARGNRFALTDGNYQLTIDGTKLHSPGGAAVTGTVSQFFRLFGDSDGDRDVDRVDLSRCLLAELRPRPTPAQLAIFDYDGNGVVDAGDYREFRLRYGHRMVETPVRHRRLVGFGG